MGGLRSLPGERPCRWRAARGVPPSGESGGKARGLMRCSKMAMRRKSEMRTAVAANPKEMASMDVPKSLSVDASPLPSAAAATAAAGSDGVDAGSPGHGRDLCPNPLMAARPALASSSAIRRRSIYLQFSLC